MSSLVIAGDVSGSVTLQAPSAAGSAVLTLPTASGTVALTSGASAFTDLTVTNGALIQGLTVGKGAGAVSTNTAVGASALSANTTGSRNTANGYGAGNAIATGVNSSFFGSYAGYNTTGSYNTFVGDTAGQNVTTGTFNLAIGGATLNGGSGSGSYNTAVGVSALSSNTTASANTAVGYQAGNTNILSTNNLFVGYKSGYTHNLAVAGAGYNCFVGDESGFSVTSGVNNALFGTAAGYSTTTGSNNTFVGAFNGTRGCGELVTTGSKNTIIGGYSGNQGGLDIRTANNYIVLSDGDGNPAGYRHSNGRWRFGLGGTGSTSDGIIELNGANASGYGPALLGYKDGDLVWQAGTYSWIVSGTSSNYMIRNGYTGGVYLSGAGATSWTSASDERLKENLVEITDAANKVASLRAVIGNWKSDADKTRKPFLIAQDVQAVLPEAVSQSVQSKDDPTEYLGVSYTDVIPLLVAAIKELKAEFDAYKEAHP